MPPLLEPCFQSVSPVTVSRLQDVAATLVGALRAGMPAAIDGLMGEDYAMLLLRRMKDSRDAGRMRRGPVGAKGPPIRDEIRRDFIEWAPREDRELAPLLKKIDRLIELLGKHPELNTSKYLGGITCRTQPMLAYYSGDGAHYSRHVDNEGHDPEDHRVLTCVYYTTPSWSLDRGGQLRVWEGCSKRSQAVDVAPRADRLVLFWADSRCPHEVRPARHERCALSVWYRDLPYPGQSCTPERTAFAHDADVEVSIARVALEEKSVYVDVVLPTGLSASAVELDVSSTELRIAAKGSCRVHGLPCAVCPGAGSAILCRKQNLLRITLQRA
eukprot:TRINITY_DN46297_c0_g1_i1.p1 TRINITY_DN46297_c0_g1~~TRINITY_DN46297_c0_g1_i1.p1  ORF type:complete len:328 (+),score=16.67 TRINITY_DN46297_c0_g1_i1:110-1093(+)